MRLRAGTASLKNSIGISAGKVLCFQTEPRMVETSDGDS
jgi:hypothetical protein